MILILANFNLFEFSSAILEKGLFTDERRCGPRGDKSYIYREEMLTHPTMH